jgi:hypothetical protein
MWALSYLSVIFVSKRGEKMANEIKIDGKELKVFIEQNKNKYSEMEAMEWLKGKREGFACNFFDGLESFKDFVRELYNKGATYISIELEKGNEEYSDTCFVTLPQDRDKLKEVMISIINNMPDELTEQKKDKLMLWWD